MNIPSNSTLGPTVHPMSTVNVTHSLQPTHIAPPVPAHAMPMTPIHAVPPPVPAHAVPVTPIHAVPPPVPAHAVPVTPLHAAPPVPAHAAPVTPLHAAPPVPAHAVPVTPLHAGSVEPTHMATVTPVHADTLAPTHMAPAVPVHGETFVPTHMAPAVPVHGETFVPTHMAPSVPTHAAPISTTTAELGHGTSGSVGTHPMDPGPSSQGGYEVPRSMEHLIDREGYTLPSGDQGHYESISFSAPGHTIGETPPPLPTSPIPSSPPAGFEGGEARHWSEDIRLPTAADSISDSSIDGGGSKSGGLLLKLGASALAGAAGGVATAAAKHAMDAIFPSNDGSGGKEADSPSDQDSSHSTGHDSGSAGGDPGDPVGNDMSQVASVSVTDQLH